LTNNEISPKLRSDLQSLNSDLVENLKAGKVNEIENMLAENLLAQGEKQINSELQQISKNISFSNYELLDEYYLNNIKFNNKNVISSPTVDSNAYTLNYQSITNETYISLLTASSIDGEFLILIIYGKYKNQWKINFLNIGQYSFFGMNAIDYYKLSKSKYLENDLVDAEMFISVSNLCIKPGKEVFHFNNETEVMSLKKSIDDDFATNFKFPMQVDALPKSPKIIRVYPYAIPEGFFPMIEYQSYIDIKDTLKLTDENMKLRTKVGQIFPGIDKDKKYIFYRACNIQHSLVEDSFCYGFIQDIQNP
jgi:hypothetical protein